MSAWLQRNTVPILIVLAASAVVIIGFELLDGLATSEPLGGTDEDAALNVGGLIKVTLFLAIPGALTLRVRRGQSANRA